MDHLQSHRLKALLDEIELQLKKLDLETPVIVKDRSGVIESYDSNVDRHYRNSLRNLASHIQRSIAASIPEQRPADAISTEPPEKSLVWKVPAFCGDSVVIDQEFVKSRIETLQRHGSASDKYTDDIWSKREIIAWEESEKSSVILVEGTSQTLRRLQSFGVQMVNHLEKTQHVLHLLSPLPATVSLEANDVLRQLAIQLLQKLPNSDLPEVTELIATTTCRFQSGLDEDYFSVMEEALRWLRQPVSIIFNTQALQPCNNGPPWPKTFQSLCAKVGGTARSRVNVMIISSRRLNAVIDEGYCTLVRIVSCPVVSIAHAHSMRQDSIVRPDRTPASVLSWNEETNELTSYVSPTIPTRHFDDSATVCSAQGSRTSPCLQLSTNTETAHTADSVLRDAPIPVHGVHKYTLALKQHGLGDPLNCGNFDIEGFQDADSTSSRGASESWFKLLESKTHEFMYGRTEYEPNSYKNVKVAVLDTGFAYTEAKDKQALKPYRHRIAKFCNFVDDGMDESAAKQDPSGHGTVVAVQIAKVCRNVLLYICRVSKRGADNTWAPEKYAVERAIRKAATPEDQDGWGVDIINMSFGWQYDDHQGLREAIQLARTNGVHMFAPTSNDGLLGPHIDISYPSIAQEVISIDAADGLGENTRFNPSSQSFYGGTKRFSAPGLDLWIPKSDKKWSGSSFACAVAAGICALVLEFVRQPPLQSSPSMQKTIKHMSAMTDIIRLMSKAKGPEKLEFMLPWLVLGNLEENRLDTSYVIVRELRKRYGPGLGNEPWR